MDNATRWAYAYRNSQHNNNIELSLPEYYHALQHELEKVFTEELRIEHQLRQIYSTLQTVMLFLSGFNKNLEIQTQRIIPKQLIQIKSQLESIILSLFAFETGPDVQTQLIQAQDNLENIIRSLSTLDEVVGITIQLIHIEYKLKNTVAPLSTFYTVLDTKKQLIQIKSQLENIISPLPKLHTESDIQTQLIQAQYNLESAISSLSSQDSELDEAWSENYPDFVGKFRKQCEIMREHQETASVFYKRYEIQCSEFDRVQDARYSIQKECDQLGLHLYENKLISLPRMGSPPRYDAYPGSSLSSADNNSSRHDEAEQPYMEETPPATPKLGNIPTPEDLSDACKELSALYQSSPSLKQEPYRNIMPKTPRP